MAINCTEREENMEIETTQEQESAHLMRKNGKKTTLAYIAKKKNVCREYLLLPVINAQKMDNTVPMLGVCATH